MMKKSSHRPFFLIYILVGAALSLTVGMVLRSYLAPETVQAQPAAPISPVVPILEKSEVDGIGDAVEAPQSPILSDNQANVQIANGIQMTFSNPRRGLPAGLWIDPAQEEAAPPPDQYVLVDVCFDLPDNRGWSLWDFTLQQADYRSVDNYGYEYLEIRSHPENGNQELMLSGQDIVRISGEDMQPARRCDTVSFGDAPKETGDVYQLTISGIVVEPYEGQSCEPAYLERVQKTMDAHKTGIVVGCMEESWGGGLTVESKSAAMSEEEAYLTLMQPEIFVEIHGIAGPWVFDFKLDQ